MPNVLITAFEPYDRWKENASWLSLIELTRNLPEQPRVVTRLYPVDFQRARARLEDDLQADYDFALHLGQAPGTGRIQLEAIGLNIGGTAAQSPDQFQPLDPNGPVACQSDLPLGDWAEQMRGAGIPATVSYHAGTYLCNAVLYLSLHLAKLRGLKTRSAFIHLPLTPQQVLLERSDYASMSPAISAAGIRLILEAISEQAKLAAA
jgi:pyroglutamyl-peptidase